MGNHNEGGHHSSGSSMAFCDMTNKVVFQYGEVIHSKDPSVSKIEVIYITMLDSIKKY